MARAAVDAATATATATAAAAADQGEDVAGCNEDLSACASPAAAIATSLSPVAGAMPRQRIGPPLSGVVLYFSLSSDNKDEDKDNDAAFNDGNVVGREVGRR